MRNALSNFTILLVASLSVIIGCAKDHGSLASRPKSFATATWDKIKPDKKATIGQGTMFSGAHEGGPFLAKKSEEGRFRRAISTVTDSKVVKNVSNSMKHGTAKVADALTPDPQNAVDPLSLSKEPEHVDADFYLALARHQERAGQHEGAEKQYRKALKLEPYNLSALIGYAHLLDRQNRLDEAIGLYRTACEKHPSEAAVFNDLGLCYARQSKLAESLQALEKAVALQPERKLYRNNIATVLVEFGRLDAALSHLQSVHGPAIAQYNLAFLLHEKGDISAAADHFTSALAADPSLSEARDWLARIEREHPGSTYTSLPPKMASQPHAPPNTPEMVRTDLSSQHDRFQPSTSPSSPVASPGENAALPHETPMGHAEPGGNYQSQLPLQPDERAMWPDDGYPPASSIPDPTPPRPTDFRPPVR